GAPADGARLDGRAPRGVGADLRYLRGFARLAAREGPAVVRRVPAPDAPGLLPSRTGDSRVGFTRLDVHRRDVLEGELQNLDERRSRLREEGRPRRRG